MNYFVNENIFTLNSGTEFSAIKRLQLFKQKGVPAKVLTRNYSAQLAGDAKRAGLEQSDVLNMYDYFQEITEEPMEDLDVRYTEAIDKNTYHIEGIDADHSLIKHAGKTVAKVQIAPATVGLVGSIEYYDDLKGISAKDIWDRRGFKSSTQYYHQDGNAGAQLFFNRKGEPKIELIHMNINGRLMPTMYRLLSYKGRVWRFDNEDEMFVFFMNELASQEESVFINDRPSLVPALAAVTNAKGKWQFLHNTHAANNAELGVPRQVVPYLQPTFNQFGASFDGVLVATEHQCEDIQKIPTTFKQAIAVPDTYAEEIELEDNTRDMNKLIYLGRQADDKGTLEAVKIFEKIHKKLPEARLEFYGYSSPQDVQKKIEEYATNHGIKEAVQFKGYLGSEQLVEELKHSALLLSTSSAESFGMTILEAMSAGVPVLAFDVKYGLQEQIESGVNGLLIQRGAIQKAADAAVTLLRDPESHAAYSKAAYESAQRFSAANAWNVWLEKRNQADNLFVEA
jgi:poly(glycerol-phosphate) alpha-glucosyltransferase